MLLILRLIKMLKQNKMKKIKIKHNPNGDTRTVTKPATFSDFHKANTDHIKDVNNVMKALGNRLKTQGYCHDGTKIQYEDLFYENYLDSILNGKDFVSNEWYQKHIHAEKHHPFSYCHDDINLLDILETIVDCVCAGKARSGEIRPLEFDEEILKKAVVNTVKLIDEMTEVDE